MDRPFLILVAAFGNEMRGILGAKLKIWAELPDEENKFWLKVVQNAGKFGGKSPVEHWLAKIAKNQARNALRSPIRRTKWVAYRMSTEVEMRDAEEYAEERMLTPDEVLGQEELAKGSASSGDVYSWFVGGGNGRGDYSKQRGGDHF